MSQPRISAQLRRGAVVVVTVVFVSTATRGTVLAQSAPTGLDALRSIERGLVELIERAEVSVVSIARIRRDPAPLVFRRPDPFGLEPGRETPADDPLDPRNPDFIPDEFGAGVVIRPLGEKTEPIVLTTFHVVRGGPIAGQPEGNSRYSLYVRFSDRRGCYAHIRAGDPRSDLAVLTLDFAQLGRRPADLPALPLSRADHLRKGQIVVALGNPYALARDGSASASWGIISNIARRPAPVAPSGMRPNEQERKRETIHHYGTLLQVDTRLQLGTSGGPLINLDGELIGITTAMAALEGYERSVGYAIPMDAATRRIVLDLARGFEVEYGFLGIYPSNALPEELAPLRQVSPEIDQVLAARVRDVIPNSPAQAAGIRRGDLILSVDGRVVHGSYDLMREVGQRAPSTSVTLRIWRPSTRESVMTRRVRLGKWPVYDDEGIVATRMRFPPWRGLIVDYPTGRMRFLSFPPQYHRAVAVREVMPRSPADRAGLRPGDLITHVDRTPVGTPAEFHAAVRRLPDGEAVDLHLLDGRRVIVRQ